MNAALYNEIDPFAAAWLEQLVERGHIGPGVVDRRSIADLSAADVAGPGQRHFFAGIGGWSYALRCAGVPDDADVWTGSCPCQPFSGAGKGLGTLDARHLWPTWFDLIEKCRPPIVFGEQVASRDGLAWLDLVRADLERCGYAVGASDLCAAGVGAPHIRQRLFFVAYADSLAGRLHVRPRQPRPTDLEASRGREARELADPVRAGRTEGRTRSGKRSTPRRSGSRGLGDASRDGTRKHPRELSRDEGEHEERGADSDHAPIVAGAARIPWEPCDWIPCTDGVSRPVEPGTFPLAHGVPGRVGRLRGYGNAIVTEAAIAFIECALDAIGDVT